MNICSDSVSIFSNKNTPNSYSLEFFHNLLFTLPYPAFFLNEQGKMVKVNDAFKQYLNVTEEQQDFKALIAGESLVSELDHFFAEVKRDGFAQMSVALQSNLSLEHRALLKATYLGVGEFNYLAFLEDQSAFIQEARLQENLLENFRLIKDKCPTPIAIVDENGTASTLNAAFLQQFGRLTAGFWNGDFPATSGEFQTSIQKSGGVKVNCKYKVHHYQQPESTSTHFLVFFETLETDRYLMKEVHRRREELNRVFEQYQEQTALVEKLRKENKELSLAQKHHLAEAQRLKGRIGQMKDDFILEDLKEELAQSRAYYQRQIKNLEVRLAASVTQEAYDELKQELRELKKSYQKKIIDYKNELFKRPSADAVQNLKQEIRKLQQEHQNEINEMKSNWKSPEVYTQLQNQLKAAEEEFQAAEAEWKTRMNAYISVEEHELLLRRAKNTADEEKNTFEAKIKHLEESLSMRPDEQVVIDLKQALQEKNLQYERQISQLKTEMAEMADKSAFEEAEQAYQKEIRALQRKIRTAEEEAEEVQELMAKNRALKQKMKAQEQAWQEEKEELEEVIEQLNASSSGAPNLVEDFGQTFLAFSMPFAICKPSGEISFANNSLLALRNKKLHHLQDLLPPEDKVGFSSNVEGLEGSFEVKVKDGSVRMYDFEQQAFEQNSDKTYFYFLRDRTELENLSNRLQQSEIRLYSFFNSAPTSICFLNKEGEFTAVNAHFSKELGYSEDAVLGKSLHLLVDEADQAQWEMRIEKSFNLAYDIKGEFDLLDSEGQYRTILTQSAMIEGDEGEQELALFMVDITERKLTEELIRMSEQKFNSLFKKAPVGICITNDDGIFETVNDRYKEIYGYAESELVGQHFSMVVPSEDDGFWKNKHELFIKGADETRGEFNVINKVGELMIILADSALIRGSDGQPRKVTFVTDITDKKRQEHEITEKNKELEKAFKELKNTQHQLLIAEKMAALGQLIAGVAHEVNTPISAIKASVRNMIRTVPQALNELPNLLLSLGQEEIKVFQKLVHHALTSKVELSAREERKTRKEVRSIFNSAGIENASELASNLVEIGVIDKIEDYMPLFKGDDSLDIIDMVYKLGQIRVSMANIDSASDKTAKVVSSLKSYAHVQAEEKMVETDLKQNMETVLTIMTNQLKYGIDLQRDYQEDMPKVMAYQDEISQVWTNIINNAVQAMESVGKLKISIYEEDKNAVVKIEDDGPGIPPEIRERIFEPFFTTKTQGEGSGLGLDICKKIVEKHQGTIAVDSAPGKTEFTITIPVDKEEA